MFYIETKIAIYYYLNLFLIFVFIVYLICDIELNAVD